MIGALSGNIVEQSDSKVIVDVQGVGYEVSVSHKVLSSISRIPQPIRLTIYTDVKENSILLYGFSDAIEKEVFLLLKKVKGIGSKIALSIISGIGAEGLLMSVGRSDVSLLKSVSGVGSKTAERIVMELRECVHEILYVEESAVNDNKKPLSSQVVVSKEVYGSISVETDVVMALEKLGFSGERARQVVTKAVEDHANANPGLKKDAGELLRLALASL